MPMVTFGPFLAGSANADPTIEFPLLLEVIAIRLAGRPELTVREFARECKIGIPVCLIDHIV